MTFKQGVSGNLHGNRHRTRHLLNQEFMQALLLNFRHQGKKAIEKVARNQPAVYLKILALLVPRELKIEQNQSVKAMTDEQLEAGIEAIQRMLEARASDQAKVIEALPEPAALPAPPRKAKRKASPLLLDEQELASESAHCRELRTRLLALKGLPAWPPIGFSSRHS